MKTTAVFLPFDLFGSGGTGAGALALADALDEILADNKRERSRTRADAYADRVRVRRLSYETLGSYEHWQNEAREEVRAAWKRGDFLLWTSGNHLGVLPIYEELGGAGDALVVQLDAHLDVQNFSGYSREPSHANFLLHCQQPPAVINIGHRDLLLTAAHVRKYYQAAYSASELAIEARPALDHIRKAVAVAGRVFIDIDCDVLDPAYFPAAAHPVPFGLSPKTVLSVIDAALAGRVVGMAVSEFDPGRDQTDRSLALLAWLLEYVLLRVHEPSA